MATPSSIKSGPLLIGWAEVDITPSIQPRPVPVCGQFHTRLSEGVADPLYATACVIEQGSEHVVFVCCDLVVISEPLKAMTRELLAERNDGLDPMKVIFNATHTHEGPELRLIPISPEDAAVGRLELGAVPVKMGLEFTSARLAECIAAAWEGRAVGGIAYGMDYAVIGRNRRWVDSKGTATMYGLASEEARERFRHFEGYEDHSLNLLATYDEKGGLMGIIVNIPCPSQEDEQSFSLSADFWHEARRELRQRFGEKLFILPQVSAAGELTSHIQYEGSANQRMRKLKGVTARQEIAIKIADAVGRILPYISNEIESAVILEHRVEKLELPLNRLTEADAESNRAAAESYRQTFEAEFKKVQADPELRKQPRWYVNVTAPRNRMRWHQGVVERFESQKTEPTVPHEIHIVRLGSIAFASNPFEYYLDFGIQIKVRSPAIQTFLVQLTGNGTYVPSPRSVAGGGYGSVAASNPFGAEAGQILADNTVRILLCLWGDEGQADRPL